MDWKSYFDPSKVYIQHVDNIVIPSGLSNSKFSANPYIGCPHACMYCYVPCMKHGPVNPSERWGCYLGVKEWEPLLATLKYRDKVITIGSSTDPYNPLEPHFQRTHHLLAQLQDSGAIISVITKSDLVLNDLDILSSFDKAMVAFSICSLDEKFISDMEAAPSVSDRLKAMSICKDRGILTSCFISPVFPGITDVFEIIEAVRNNCDVIWIDTLNLQDKNLGKVTGYVSMEYSSLFPLYRRMFTQGDTTYWNKLSADIREYAQRQALPYSNANVQFECSPIGKPTVIDYIPKRISMLPKQH